METPALALAAAGAAAAITLLGCSAFGQEEAVPWDTDVPESEVFDATMGIWSPDGQRIAFVHTDLDQTGQGPFDALWIYDLGTDERLEVAPGRIIYPDWSPDGQWLVFQTASDPEYLWKIRADGTGALPLTGPGSPSPTLRYTILGKWHPSGDSLLFTISAGDLRGTWLMRPDGAGARQVLPYGVHGSWFPDGERIAYVDWDSALPAPRDQQVFVAKADGTGTQRITNRTTDQTRFPAVSPDGEQIAFLDWDSSDGEEVYLMDADGANLRQVTGGSGLIDRVDWAPDGRRILFDRWIPNVSRRLYLLDVQTLEVTPLFPAGQE